MIVAASSFMIIISISNVFSYLSASHDTTFCRRKESGAMKRFSNGSELQQLFSPKMVHTTGNIYTAKLYTPVLDESIVVTVMCNWVIDDLYTINILAKLYFVVHDLNECHTYHTAGFTMIKMRRALHAYANTLIKNPSPSIYVFTIHQFFLICHT